MTNMKKGVQFWLARSKHGVDSIMKDPQTLYESCIEYFDWARDNPLTEEKVGFSMGFAVRADIYHPRAMTIKGLCTFIGITEKTWFEWLKTRDDLRAVQEWAAQIIFDQKFTAAAAGLLNANLIARELGLADKQVQEVVTPKMVIRPPDGEAPPEPPIHGE